MVLVNPFCVLLKRPIFLLKSPVLRARVLKRLLLIGAWNAKFLKGMVWMGLDRNLELFKARPVQFGVLLAAAEQLFTMLGVILSDHIPGDLNLTLTLTADSN